MVEMEMSPVVIGYICWGVLLVLLFLEMPVGVALLLVSFAGIWCLKDLPFALHVVARVAYDTSTMHLLCLVPLFVFMGQLANEGELGSDLFHVAYKWLGGVRGGLAMTTTATAVGFGAVCGDGIAGAATMTSVCLPEMRKYKYDDNLSLATICSGGILSFLIPPSLGFIFYGILANANISDLFIGGVIPGVLCAFGYMVVIYILCWLNPSKGPPGPITTWGEKLLSLGYLWGVIILLIIVFGGIYSGFITVVEAGALGAFGAFVISLIKRRMNWKKFTRAVINSVQMVGMVFLMFIGAWTFAPFLSLTRIPATIITFMGGWPPSFIILFTLVFFFIGGMVFEATILMLITIPLFLPLWTAAGLNLVWFGVTLMVIIITSGLTPPVGLIVYVVSGITGTPSGPVFKEVVWFIIPLVIVAALCVIFPKIVTFLPNLLR